MFRVRVQAVPDSYIGPFFLAGQEVEPGIYLEVNSRREVRLDRPGALPPSFDGRVAIYVRRPASWGELPKGS